MRSFKIQTDNRREVYLALMASIESQLREAYAKRHAEGLDTQSSLAEKIGVNRSAINRRLTGRQKNMTIETVADLVWALEQCISVDIHDPKERPSNEHRIIPQHVPTKTETVTGLGSASQMAAASTSTSQIAFIALR